MCVLVCSDTRQVWFIDVSANLPPVLLLHLALRHQRNIADVAHAQACTHAGLVTVVVRHS